MNRVFREPMQQQRYPRKDQEMQHGNVKRDQGTATSAKSFVE